jgi:hypothetical protein
LGLLAMSSSDSNYPAWILAQPDHPGVGAVVSAVWFNVAVSQDVEVTDNGADYGVYETAKYLPYLGAVLVEQTDDRAEGHRCIGPELLAAAGCTCFPARTPRPS